MSRVDADKDGLSRKELAAALEVSRETIREWGLKDWLVRSPSGKFFDLEATRQRHALYVEQRGGKTPCTAAPPGARAPDEPVLTAEQAKVLAAISGLDKKLLALSPDEVQRRLKVANMRQAEADAEHAEVKLAKDRGELVSLTDAKRIYAEVFGQLKAAIEAMPGNVAPRIVGLTEESEIRAMLAKGVERVLEGVSSADPIV